MSCIFSRVVKRQEFFRCVIWNTSQRCKHDEVRSSVKSVPKKELDKFRQFLLSKFLQFVKGYEKVLESKFPAAMRVYRMFMVGSMDFYKDMKQYFKVTKKIHSSLNGYRDLPRSEIELYYKMRKDVYKVAPVLLLSTLPFANYVVFPMAYLFPRQLLCSHFWSLQQRLEFSIYNHRLRLYNYRPVFRALQAQVDNLQSHPLQPQWAHALSLVGSGIHPSTDEILSCIDLFCDYPYHILHLYTGHVKSLLKMHGMHVGWRRRSRLVERGELLHAMDMAIVKEGGVKSMSYEEIRWACFFRGMNPVNMRDEDLIEWLKNWITVSQQVDQRSLSLLLHCPILLAYNYPSNWTLIH